MVVILMKYSGIATSISVLSGDGDVQGHTKNYDKKTLKPFPEIKWQVVTMLTYSGGDV
jgi:hypothetical protein